MHKFLFEQQPYISYTLYRLLLLFVQKTQLMCTAGPYGVPWLVRVRGEGRGRGIPKNWSPKFDKIYTNYSKKNYTYWFMRIWTIIQISLEPQVLSPIAMKTFSVNIATKMEQLETRILISKKNWRHGKKIRNPFLSFGHGPRIYQDRPRRQLNITGIWTCNMCQLQVHTLYL